VLYQKKDQTVSSLFFLHVVAVVFILSFARSTTQAKGKRFLSRQSCHEFQTWLRLNKTHPNFNGETVIDPQGPRPVLVDKSFQKY